MFLPFEVGDGESSAVLEAGVLDGDEFPAFFAEVVEVVLYVFDDWCAGSFYDVCMYAGFYGDGFVFPLWHLGHRARFRVRLGLGFRR